MYDRDLEFGSNNDPFRLVPVGYYVDGISAPFTVDISSDALVITAFKFMNNVKATNEYIIIAACHGISLPSSIH